MGGPDVAACAGRGRALRRARARPPRVVCVAQESIRDAERAAHLQQEQPGDDQLLGRVRHPPQPTAAMPHKLGLSCARSGNRSLAAGSAPPSTVGRTPSRGSTTRASPITLAFDRRCAHRVDVRSMSLSTGSLSAG